MSRTATYSLIASNTVTGSAVSSVAFNSIPQTFTDLILICNNLTESTNQQGYIRFNGDSGSNYSRTLMYGDGTSAVSFRQTNQSGLNVGMSSTAPGQTIIMNIMDYSNSTTFKTVLDRQTNTGTTQALVYLWRSTSAISSLTINSFDGSNSISVGSKFRLYGIQAGSN